MTEDFSMETAAKALAFASDALQKAGITKIWIDMDGAGWTEDYRVIIESKNPTKKKVGTAIYYQLEPDITAIVSKALHELYLGERIILNFSASQNRGNENEFKLVWPAMENLKRIQRKIESFQVELDKWRTLAKISSNSAAKL